MGVKNLSHEEASELVSKIEAICDSPLASGEGQTEEFYFDRFFNDGVLSMRYSLSRPVMAPTTRDRSRGILRVRNREGDVVFDCNPVKGEVKSYVPGDWESHLEDLYTQSIQEGHRINL